MQCPIDSQTLVMTERNGVEIDYCPKCRGVWLDRGELDKIIERAGSQAPVASFSSPPAREPAPASQQHSREAYGSHDAYSEKKPKKRESFLSELFDF